MSHAVCGYSLYEALEAEGFVLPTETADVTIEFPVDGVAQMVVRKNLVGDELAAVGRALQRLGVERTEDPRLYEPGAPHAR